MNAALQKELLEGAQKSRDVANEVGLLVAARFLAEQQIMTPLEANKIAEESVSNISKVASRGVIYCNASRIVPRTLRVQSCLGEFVSRSRRRSVRSPRSAIPRFCHIRDISTLLGPHRGDFVDLFDPHRASGVAFLHDWKRGSAKAPFDADD